VFELADRNAGRALPHAVVPRIALKGPKITRPLTTEWFADRVDARHRRCVERGARASAPSAQAVARTYTPRDAR
jgi:hypothetical protein